MNQQRERRLVAPAGKGFQKLAIGALAGERPGGQFPQTRDGFGQGLRHRPTPFTRIMAR